jgi:hypothetical protein
MSQRGISAGEVVGGNAVDGAGFLIIEISTCSIKKLRHVFLIFAS